MATFVLPMVVALTSGCVSSEYRRADGVATAPAPLNLSAEKSPLAATLHTVIWLHGPGSWKRDAWWDEYVVSVKNTGDQPLVLDAAALGDFRHQSTLADDAPWDLEEQSRLYTDKINREAKTVLVTAGHIFVGSYVTLAAAMGGGPAGLVLYPAYLIGAKKKNDANRRDLEEEFHRRRLKLPVTLAPGETVQGSLFFRLSPGPTDLSLRAAAGTERTIITLDLKPLSGLHLNPSPSAQPGDPSARSVITP